MGKQKRQITKKLFSKHTVRLVPAFHLFLLCVGCLVCNNKKANTEIERPVIRDLPGWLVNDTTFELRERRLLKEMDLSSLESGFKGIQIRIWLDCVRQDTADMVLIKEAEAEWEVVFYSYTIEYPEQEGYVLPKITNVRKKVKKPISGWKFFSVNLLATLILELPDYTDMSESFSIPNDANGVVVEIGLPGKYRIYSYPALGFNKNIQNGPANFERALLLIEKEFNYKRKCDL